MSIENVAQQHGPRTKMNKKRLFTIFISIIFAIKKKSTNNERTLQTNELYVRSYRIKGAAE